MYFPTVCVVIWSQAHQRQRQIVLLFLSPTTWSISWQLNLSGTCLHYISFSSTSRAISFLHTYELHRPKQTSFGAFGLDRRWGWFHTAKHLQSPQFIQFTKGVLFHCWDQSIELCYPDGCNSIKRTLHLGPWRKRAYQKPAVREVLRPSIVSCERREWTLSTISPPSLLSAVMSSTREASLSSSSSPAGTSAPHLKHCNQTEAGTPWT